jgi:hypothetical protein
VGRPPPPGAAAAIVLSAQLPTGTVTFLFTDIEGSTRLIDALGDRYWRRGAGRAAVGLRRARRAAAPVLASGTGAVRAYVVGLGGVEDGRRLDVDAALEVAGATR